MLPYLPTVLSVKQQIQDEFLPLYTTTNGTSNLTSLPAWKSTNTLFTFFIGINDVGNSYASMNSSLNSIIFSVYSGLLEQVYAAGARNFLFLNVPPVDRSPLTKYSGPNATQNVAIEHADIADWNSRLVKLVGDLEARHGDTTALIFDTNGLFDAVLDDPAVYPQTAVYQNTTDYCEAYEK